MIIPDLPKEFSHPVCVGVGAFGSVYRVKQSALDRLVAVKIIKETDAVVRGKLLREARIQARIDAKCIPQVYDAFEWKRKNVFIVMQWIKGVSLSKLLETDLSTPERFSIAEAFLTSLAELHSLNFAHRDLKPDNILLSCCGKAFLVDFGFTKDVLNGDISLSMNIKGTPAYMAPELWANGGGDMDHVRADLFSAGRILAQIIGDPHSDLLDMFMKQDPRKRPEHGAAALCLWKERVKEFNLDTSWRERVVELANSHISRRLLFSAKQLMYNGRFNEGYLHLVECLEFDSENREALDAIHDFSRVKKNHRFKYLVSRIASVLVVVFFLILSFIAGKRSSGSIASIDVGFRKDRDRMVFLDKKNHPSASAREMVEFELMDTHLDNSFSAKVVFISDRQGYTVRIGDKSIRDQKQLRRGVEIEHGTHQITVYDSENRMVRNKSVEVLPFQTRHVRIP